MSEPVLRVISGDPSPEELAAVLAVVLRPQATVVEPEPTSQWNDRSHALRTPLTPGPHAWRASARS
ncbi:MAG: acyl-CoA carboxylase subunit epsilon [Actinomycetes bacterium]